MKKFFLLILCCHFVLAQDISKKLEEYIAFEKYDQVILDVDNALLINQDRKQTASLMFYKAQALFHLGELQESFDILKELVEDYNFEIDYEIKVLHNTAKDKVLDNNNITKIKKVTIRIV